MRTAWKGTLQFGLLAIPLRLGLAVDTDESLFHQMHHGCGGRIKQRRFCGDCGAEVAWADVAKGVDGGAGMVEVTDEEIEELRAWVPKTISLLHFAPADQVDPLLYDKAYYVEPVDGGGPAHALLLQALATTPGLAAVCTLAYPGRVSLALLQPRGAMFILTALLWPEQLRPADVKLPPVVQPRPQEIKMAAQLVKSMTRDFNPADHVDANRQALVDLVAAKATGTTPPAARQADPAKPYADMMDLLQASIAAAKEQQPKPARRRTAKAS